MKYLFLLILAFANHNVFSQQELTANKQAIATLITNYFDTDRDNIHLHLDKNIFLNTENVWFKGYVFDRKVNNPFYKTVNVYANLINSNGLRMSQKLIFAENGTFTGNFNLKDFESGDYYIQIFTNYMNNYIEDESFVTKIQIINPNKNDFNNSNEINYETLKINFNPEGNTFIENVSNNIGFTISDCNDNLVPNIEGEIFDANNNNIRFIKTNKLGFGRFNINPTRENYKVVFVINEKKIEANLPNVSSTGFSLEVNQYNLPDKTDVKIKTNSQTINTLVDKNLTLLIQQDEKYYFFDVNFDNLKTEQELVFSNEYLFDGMNIIRLLDKNNNEIAQRLIYNYQDNILKSEIYLQSKTNNTYAFAGNINAENDNISITVVPEKNIGLENEIDIYASLLINPYLIHPIKNGKYYFKDSNRTIKYELDMALLNQKSSKYLCNNILNLKPKTNFEFEQGLKIKGTINQNLTNRADYKIRAYSLVSQIIEFSEINDKDEFLFKNLVVADSSKINFGLVKKTDLSSIPLKYFAQVENKNQIYNKQFKPEISDCKSIDIKNNENKLEFPKLKKNEVLLSEVEIKAKKNKLVNENKFGNSGLRGYKITDDMGNSSVLDFISSKGFQVNRIKGEIQILRNNRGVNSIYNTNRRNELNDAILPNSTVILNEFQLFNFDELTMMRLEDIDEIYVSQGSSVINNANVGFIKIYSKKPKPQKTFTNSFMITNGFEINKKFKNTDYDSTIDKGFENLGVVNFIQNINTEENGYFRFEIPNMNQKTVKIQIEGFSADGRVISEIKNVNLE